MAKNTTFLQNSSEGNITLLCPDECQMYLLSAHTVVKISLKDFILATFPLHVGAVPMSSSLCTELATSKSSNLSASLGSILSTAQRGTDRQGNQANCFRDLPPLLGYCVTIFSTPHAGETEIETNQIYVR